MAKRSIMCGLAFLVTVAATQLYAQDLPDAARATRILQQANVKGGLIVHLGCGDGRLTASLACNKSLLVHGLAIDGEQVTVARRNIATLGLYGRVSVDEFEGRHLPYVDNLVNLLVVSSSGAHVSNDEMMRVLCPGGVAVKLDPETQNPNPQTFRKPWPSNIDQWTHTMHDSGGNAVARDTVVGPPHHLRWTAGPVWQRSHGYTPSVSAFVSANGRVFYIVDESLTGAGRGFPSKWFLVARDAFNGRLLWQREIAEWGSRAFESGGSGRISLPHNISKRLVAIGDTVYVTMGAKAPVTGIDASTGEDLRIYERTEHTDEIVVTGGTMIVSVNPKHRTAHTDTFPSPALGKRLRAIDLNTGKFLWERGPFSATRVHKSVDPFGRFELVAGDGKLFILTAETIEAFALDTGKTLWRVDRPDASAETVRAAGWSDVFEFLMTSLVYHNNVLLVAQPEPNIKHTYHTSPGRLYAFDANDGRLMWNQRFGYWAVSTPPDVFVVDRLVWTHVHTDAEMQHKVPPAGDYDYRIQALNLGTGKVVREWPTREIFNVAHHHRCYRNRISQRYLTTSRRGVEFVDLETGENFVNHWARSGCLLGNFPCNGLLYLMPHHCRCYIEAKLTGFNALASSPDHNSMRPAPMTVEETGRLKYGPAYTGNRNQNAEGETDRPEPAPTNSPNSALSFPGSNDWPTYRRDCVRSGATESQVEMPLRIVWKTRAGDKLSAPVIAGGKVLVANVDAHAIEAFDAASGSLLWSRTVGGRVTSPPTIYDGLAIFGANDGRVYALRASDGTLAWRFDGAPIDRRLLAFDQIESVWPIPGNVLVHHGQCWFAAGRSSYLDGGIFVYCLDPISGKVLRKHTIFSPDPDTGKMRQPEETFRITGLLNDIPSADDTGIFIRQMCVSQPQTAKLPRLYASGGYLDSNWFHRTRWKVGQAETSGLMVLGENAAYGVEVYPRPDHLNATFLPGTGSYRLLCFGEDVVNVRSDNLSTNSPSRREAVWKRRLSLRPTALVRAADVLFIAGPPDVVDRADPHAAWEGRKGGILMAFATDDGRELLRLSLPAPPTWDGMAVSDGKVFLSSISGDAVCLGSEENEGKFLRDEGGHQAP